MSESVASAVADPRALDAYGAGRWAEAAQLFLEAVKADPRQPRPWLGLAAALANGGDTTAVLDTVRSRDTLLHDGLAFFHDVLVVLMNERRHDAVLALHTAVGGDGLLATFTSYFAGCALLLNGEEDAAFHLFSRFKMLTRTHAHHLDVGAHSHFNIAYRQGMLVEDRDYFAALAPSALARALAAVPEPQIVTRPTQQPERGVVLAACDGAYLARFGKGLVDSFARHGGGFVLHLHVVAPDGAALGHLAALAGDRVGTSFETAQPDLDAAYYSCARFLAARRLAPLWQAPVLTVDVDVELVAPLAPLAAAATETKVDFGVFRHSGYGPCSRYPAVATWFGAGTGGQTALARVSDFILSKRGVRAPFNWMLDQAALASAVRLLRGGEVKVGFLDVLTGDDWRAFLRSVGSEQEKAALAAAANR